MSRRPDHVASFLYPADVDVILDKYSDILASHIEITDKNSIYASYKRTQSKLDVLFPLKEHPIHGITGIHAIEKYNETGYVRRYHYQWKRIVPKQGIAFSHISVENEPHEDASTPEEYIVKTEPHHHHHIPGDRKQRKENDDIRTLEAVFVFVAYYIRKQTEYTP